MKDELLNGWQLDISPKPESSSRIGAVTTTPTDRTDHGDLTANEFAQAWNTQG